MPKGVYPHKKRGYKIREEIRQKYEIHFNKWGMPVAMIPCVACGKLRLVIVGVNKPVPKMCKLCFNRSEKRISAVKKALTGKPFSEEHRKRLHESWIGRETPEALRKNQQIGRKLSMATREKLSRMRKGRCFPESVKPILRQKQLESWRANRQQRLEIMRKAVDTPEVRAKISASKKRQWADKEFRVSYSGENSHCWLGGKSFEPYTKEFNEQLKSLIRDRDNHICQKCGVPERELTIKLHIHHIDYDKTNSLPSNLISLCGSCNSKVNKRRAYWAAYFVGLLLNKGVIQRGMRGERKVDFDAMQYWPNFRTDERIVQ